MPLEIVSDVEPTPALSDAPSSRSLNSVPVPTGATAPSSRCRSMNVADAVAKLPIEIVSTVPATSM